MAARVTLYHPGTADPVDPKVYPWGRVMRSTHEMMMSDPDIPLWLRVFHAALARLDKYGLSHFGYGELSEITATIDPVTGEIARSEVIGRAVKRCIQKGYFTPDSTPRRIGIALEIASVGGYEHLRLAGEAA